MKKTNKHAAKPFIDWFREAAPYIHAHRGKVFVIQIDGELFATEGFESFIHDLSILSSLGIRLVLVFGTRFQIEKALKKEHNAQFVNGLRVTDQNTMQDIKAIVGSMRFDIEALFSTGLPNSPMAEARIKVCSGNFISAKPLGVIEGVDMMFTGQVRRVDTEAIQQALEKSNIVLIPAIGYSITGALFNLSAQGVATHVATSLAADKLIFAVPFDGIENNNGSVIRELTHTETLELLDMKTTLSERDIHMLRYASEALAHAVQRVHLLDSRDNGCLLTELFQRDGSGVMLSNTRFDAIRKAHISDISGILELIQPLETQGILVPRSREKLENEINDYYLFLRDDTVVACAALHLYDNTDFAELACLVVHPNYQHSGKGEELFATMQNEAARAGVSNIFVLTTQAEHWFMEQGFVEANLESLPLKKQQMFNLKRNSKVLVKSLQ